MRICLQMCGLHKSGAVDDSQVGTVHFMLPKATVQAQGLTSEVLCALLCAKLDVFAGRGPNLRFFLAFLGTGGCWSI